MAGSNEPRDNSPPEEGDHIINWHMSYVSQISLQAETQLRAFADLIKGELIKMRTDADFIREKLPGPHHHINKLKNTDRDLRRVLDPVNELADQVRSISHRAANRIT